METDTADERYYPASMDASWRITLPAELRHPMNIDRGTRLAWVKDADGIRLQTYEETIAEIQKYFISLSPSEDIWSEDLMAQRKRDAATERAQSQTLSGSADD